MFGLIPAELHGRGEYGAHLELLRDQSEVALNFFKGIEFVLCGQAEQVLLNHFEDLGPMVVQDVFYGI